VRAVQAYNRDNTRALVGQCAALNIPQWEHKDIQRGNVVTVADYFAPHAWYLCELSMLSRETAHLKNGAQVKFHTGTSETAARVYLFQEEALEPGHQCLIQVHLNDAVVAGPGDHFIVRSLSPVRTIGGGIVVEAIGQRLRRHRPEGLSDLQERARAVKDPEQFIEYAVHSADSGVVDDRQISLRTKVPQTQVMQILAGLQGRGRVWSLGGRLSVHADTAERLQQQLLTAVADFHHRQPESPGIRREVLLTESGMRKELFHGLIERMLSAGSLVERKGLLALPGHQEQFNEAERDLLARIESLYRMRPFNPPDPKEVAGGTGAAAPEVTRAMRILVEQQRLVRIDQDLLFHSEAVAQARDRLIAYILQNGPLESVKFKYLLDTTRKYAIPMLDYFDKIGVTRRVGYTRYLNRVDGPV
jgi:selenocysteine-specific elongation factor